MVKLSENFKYPKFLLLILTIFLAYLLFHGRGYEPLHSYVTSMGYIGVFFAGIFYVYGFTAAPATSMLLILSENINIYVAGLVGGIGALLGDLIIFKFIRHSFANEVEELFKEKLVVHLNNHTPKFVKKYCLPFIACFIIASPLPDEIGVSLIAAFNGISTKKFAIMSYILNTTGIFIVLIIGSAL